MKLTDNIRARKATVDGRPQTVGKATADGRPQTVGKATADGRPQTVGKATADGRPQTVGKATADGRPQTLGKATADRHSYRCKPRSASSGQRSSVCRRLVVVVRLPSSSSTDLIAARIIAAVLIHSQAKDQTERAASINRTVADARDYLACARSPRHRRRHVRELFVR
ncbi:MAG TPA: hypothetical protein VIW64_12375 [Pyrinomonadaceae bacterium]